MLERKVADKILNHISSCWEECSKHFLSSVESQIPKAEASFWTQKNYVKLCRGHDLTPTCVALPIPTGQTAYSGSKDNAIYIYDVDCQIRTDTIVPRWDHNTSYHTKNRAGVLYVWLSF